MSLLAGQGGRGLRDRVTYGGTSPCESSYSRSARVACRPRQLDTSEAVQEGRSDLVVAKLARADDELAGRVGDGVAELHVVARTANRRSPVSFMKGCGPLRVAIRVRRDLATKRCRSHSLAS